MPRPRPVLLALTLPVLLALLVAPASADTSETPGTYALVMVTVGGAIVTSFFNIVEITDGDGSGGWGMLGILFGATGLIAGGDLTVPGAVIGALGLTSLTMSIISAEKKDGGVQVSPTLLITPDQGLQPGVAMTIGF